VNANVRFEAEADAEYRAAGRWYEKRRLGLGLEFFDAVDAALTQIVRLPKPTSRLPIFHDACDSFAALASSIELLA
jgi:hypothetical protein